MQLRCRLCLEPVEEIPLNEKPTVHGKSISRVFPIEQTKTIYRHVRDSEDPCSFVHNRILAKESQFLNVCYGQLIFSQIYLCSEG